ncbi:4-hydroxythreonine-4-phosphate dehydrogenase PdxA [Actinobaculum suis]|uniref:4-hydroxythreonine-4-phosphate dehydrogenase PdxA n=1 Tax=Actinobaculum suis TaxID=1657 RepID=UPI0008087669|nr:4-hydroxythreonine-4-phosphate dehydrogenase PdxA [Actinobaculum suis]OCA93614.1 4-hydroxythreonine-4-phosphate dehydrogenase [Actinobaculum suis]OCA93890.1 4-hydroxythreonine-4-phosphate dehydrogenase [Actinobaculum suis]
MAIPQLVMTLGDLSGIGPELAMKLCAVEDNRRKAKIKLIATKEEVTKYSEEVGLSFPVSYDAEEASIQLIEPDMPNCEVAVGVPSLAGGQRVRTDLLKALAIFKEGGCDSIIFMPLNKTALHDAGMHEDDELRWFAKELEFDGFTSELNFIPGLTTSRVTSHIGIKDVAARISAKGVYDATVLLNRTIQGIGVAKPRIGVCALNPHAGENGQFGREEIDHIEPGVRLAQHDGIDVSGPYPSDTMFVRAKKGGFDGVVTMYHDQGQIALKTMGFESGVTVQGGLPVPICTPAHGTAYEIVGQNKASLGPSQRAFDIAVDLGKHNQEAHTE